MPCQPNVIITNNVLNTSHILPIILLFFVVTNCIYTNKKHECSSEMQKCPADLCILQQAIHNILTCFSPRSRQLAILVRQLDFPGSISPLKIKISKIRFFQDLPKISLKQSFLALKIKKRNIKRILSSGFLIF